jgi:hypothetical protein
MQPTGVTRDQHCLMQIGETTRDRRSRTAATNKEHAHRAAQEFRIEHVHD